MRAGPDVTRVIIVVLDGLRADAIERFNMGHLRRLAADGATALDASTVAPSVTAAAMTSLLTGVSPARHGIASDRIFLPRTSPGITPLPELLMRRGFPTAGFMAEVPVLFRGLANRAARRLGFGTSRFVGTSAPDILLAARSTLRAQRRGLILFHWPDADRAGHEHGWMSPAYEDACGLLDGTLAMLSAIGRLAEDPRTLLIVCADHGGGGTVHNDHDSPHPLDRTIPLVFSGPSVGVMGMDAASLLDVMPTVLWALGLEVPLGLEGRIRTEIAAPTAASVAVA